MLVKKESTSKLPIEHTVPCSVKRFDIRTKNVAKLYVDVCKTDKIILNGWESSTSGLCTMKIPYIVRRLLTTGFPDLRVSFEILLESTKLLKMVSVRFF